MLQSHQSHPYVAITRHVIDWISCLVRRDYDAAERLVDAFESGPRISEYFSSEGAPQAIAPTDGEWWQISFNRTLDSDGSILVEAYIPLEGEYRPMNACFIFTPASNGFRVTFRYCQPS